MSEVSSLSFLQLLRGVHSMLSPKQRRRFIAIQAFFFVAGSSQVLGAGSVAPFVALLSKPEILHENSIASSIYSWAGFASDTQALVAMAALMIVVMALSNFLAAVSIWLTFRFSLSLGADLQEDLLRCYFGRSYIRLARENSAELINRVAVGAPRFAFNIMQPLMVIASQGTIAIIIMLALGIYQPKVVVILGGLIGCSYVILYLVVRRKLQHHGRITWQGGERRYRLLAEGLGGLKQIRLSGTESRYRDRYMQVSKEVYHSESVVGLLGDVPRFLLETVTVSALLLLASAMLLRGTDPTSVIATLTLFAMTGYRLLPAGQSIFKAVSQIKSNAPVLSEIMPDVLEGRERNQGIKDLSGALSVPDYPQVITLEDVWFTYNADGPDVLKGVSSRIPTNAMTVIVGQSGSGKSTLSDLILGLLEPNCGRVLVGDADISSFGQNWYRAVGYVPQSIFVLDDDIAGNLQFASPVPVDRETMLAALKSARLDDIASDPNRLLTYQTGEGGSRLSGGQKQRLGIARALCHKVDYLLLDEATSALDGKTEREVLSLLRELARQRTVIMIAHRVSTIQAADHIIHLDGGRVIGEGTFEQLSKSNATFRELIAMGDQYSGGSPIEGKS